MFCLVHWKVMIEGVVVNVETFGASAYQELCGVLSNRLNDATPVALGSFTRFHVHCITADSSLYDSSLLISDSIQCQRLGKPRGE